jgi:hypothetical protein
MILPPVIFTPPPKVKQTKRRTAIGRVFKSGSTSASDDIEETGDSEEVAGNGQQVRPIAGRSGRDGSSGRDDSPPYKSRSMPGLLSDSTLKILLQVQEHAQPADKNGEGA